MTEEQHLAISYAKQQNILASDISDKLNSLILLMKEMTSYQKELLTFFVALDKREMGLDDTNSQEYLTELRKDSFIPRHE